MIAVESLKKGKSAGVDNILVQARGETMFDVLTGILRIGTQSLIISLAKRATYSSARTTELPISSSIRA